MTLTRAEAEELLYREAALLDEGDWDSWLDLYTEDAVFWMPAWRDEENPTADPDRELSLIYYQGRSGLEDRVHRARSRRGGQRRRLGEFRGSSARCARRTQPRLFRPLSSLASDRRREVADRGQEDPAAQRYGSCGRRFLFGLNARRSADAEAGAFGSIPYGSCSPRDATSTSYQSLRYHMTL
jgi:hypothetical protein